MTPQKTSSQLPQHSHMTIHLSRSLNSKNFVLIPRKLCKHDFSQVSLSSMFYAPRRSEHFGESELNIFVKALELNYFAHTLIMRNYLLCRLVMQEKRLICINNSFHTLEKKLRQMSEAGIILSKIMLHLQTFFIWLDWSLKRASEERNLKTKQRSETHTAINLLQSKLVCKTKFFFSNTRNAFDPINANRNCRLNVCGCYWWK